MLIESDLMQNIRKKNICLLAVVISSLVALTVSSNVKAQENLPDTVKRLEQELSQAVARIEELEQIVAEFKEQLAHEGRIDGSGGNDSLNPPNSNRSSGGAFTLSVDANPNLVSDNETIIYEFTVTNESEDVLEGIELSFIIPSYVSEFFDSDITFEGICSSSGSRCSPGDTVSWSLKPIQPGKPVIITFTLKANVYGNGESIRSVVTASHPTGDIRVPVEVTAAGAE